MVAKRASIMKLPIGQMRTMLCLVTFALAAIFHVPAVQGATPYHIDVIAISDTPTEAPDVHPLNDQDICHGCSILVGADAVPSGRTARVAVPPLPVARLPSWRLAPLDPPPRR